MRTDLSADFLATEHGRRANDILRSCVHCGFCNATCPTYQLTGDELDGPRGRIYLIRDLLEGAQDDSRAQLHLDRCLTCRACETTCPSGVAYGELAEIARNRLGPARKGVKGLLRKFVKRLVPEAPLLRQLSRLGRLFRPLVPGRLKHHVPKAIGKGVVSGGDHARKVLLLNGCAQQVMSADTNLYLKELLDRHQVGVVAAAAEGCCGALDLHLGDEQAALARMRHNVDVLSPYLEQCEAVISTASGCGVTLKDYGRLLANDEDYAERAQALAEAVVDAVEFIEHSGLTFSKREDVARVAWHPPCTLQHGMQITGRVEKVLAGLGYELTRVQDAHLCCGSAGSYAILETEMAEALGKRKINSLLAHDPDVIVTANVGCQSHLAHRTSKPVQHWIQLLS